MTQRYGLAPDGIRTGANVKCECCLDWAKNIDRVVTADLTLFARNPLTYKGYEGKRFTHCPWCGNKLVEHVPPVQRTSESRMNYPCKVCGSQPIRSVSFVGHQMSCNRCGVGIPFPPADTPEQAEVIWNDKNRPTPTVGESQ